MKVIEDEEERRQDYLDDGDKEEVRNYLGEEQLCAGAGGHALGIDDVVADLACPGLIECAHRGEHGGDAEDAAGDVAGKLSVRVKGNGEQHNDQQREKQHGDKGVERSQLDAEVFHKVGPQGAGHDALTSGAAGLCVSLVRSAVWRSEEHTSELQSPC